MIARGPELLKVGYVSKAHGAKGEIFVRLLNNSLDWPQPLKGIFIGDSSFLVQKISRHKGGIILKLESCRSRPSALALKNQPVFLPKRIFRGKKGEKFYLAELLSFQVEALGKGYVGRIKAFRSNKGADFLCVRAPDGPEILIPLAAPYVKEINFAKKKLLLDLPENFLDIFL